MLGEEVAQAREPKAALEAQESEVSGAQGPALPSPLPGRSGAHCSGRTDGSHSPALVIATGHMVTGQNEGTGWAVGYVGLGSPRVCCGHPDSQ